MIGLGGIVILRLGDLHLRVNEMIDRVDGRLELPGGLPFQICERLLVIAGEQWSDHGVVTVLAIVVVDCDEIVVRLLDRLGLNRPGKRFACLIHLRVEIAHLGERVFAVGLALREDGGQGLRPHLVHQASNPRQRHERLELDVVHVVQALVDLAHVGDADIADEDRQPAD